jgi:hypothetical protein
MQTSLFHRTVSLSLAVVLTAVMLGTIEQLSQRPEPVAQWAQQTAVRA